MDVKNIDTKTVSNLPRLNDVSRFGRSIIEEWKNPPKDRNNALRSDQLYEERAIDVVPDYQQNQKIRNDSKFSDDKKNPTKARPHSSGTVRSIPIKHYQASLAHNIGTLRRSDAPQLQFESSISEPEKNLLHLSKYKTTPLNHTFFTRNETERVSQLPRLARVSKSSEVVSPHRWSCHSCDYQRESGSNSKINSKLKTLDRRIAKSEHNLCTRDDDQDFSDFDDYFHKSSSRRFNSRRRSDDKVSKDETVNEEMENSARQSQNDEVRVSRKWGTINLERGHVGQKISAYEENARRSGRNWNPEKYQVSPEAKKHRAIGVPLVGMHNACGLPVVASWHDHDLLESLRIRSKVLGSLRPIFKGSHASFDLNRTHPKRKAPQPKSSTSKKNRSVRSRNSDKKADYPSVRSLVSLEAGSGDIRKRRRRPSLKARKTGTFSSKNSIAQQKSSSNKNKENSVGDNNYTQSMEAESTKRQTLYARDDGEDAVQVLKSLCLNPLARTKAETGMIW